ncbi:HDOD domain-containing protein [Psychrobium sp. nBUS_13]|uniref:HDOD domain-containing protein n=1 Tax=Psychrobium sp. nBUS_13 TaxID=3395319 RepID=UPI003EB7E21E
MDFNLLVEKVNSLPSLPQAYHKCCHLLEQEVTDSAALAKVVNTDPGMTMAVLRLVNSAFYSLPRKIERLDHAISIIGQDKFRDLILTASVVEAMSRLAGGEINMEAFWRHSVLTGLLARRIGLYCYLPNSERLHIAGLLHDVGQLIYFNLLGTKALKICELVSKLGIEPRIAEHKVLGFTSHQIGGALCRAWNLPDWLTETVENHHQPSNSERFEQEASIIGLANNIAGQHFPGITSLGSFNAMVKVQHEIEEVHTGLNLSSDEIEMATEEALEQLDSVLSSLNPELSSVS